jgi:prepilin-type N-terminal cleavage/methylation domain-containing protein
MRANRVSVSSTRATIDQRRGAEPRAFRRRGFTLLEVIIVLLLMAMATALVAPSIGSRQPSSRDELAALLQVARVAAVRRGEVVTVTVAASGQWRLDGDASAADGPIATGQLGAKPAAALTVAVSPLGGCAPALDSASTVLLASVDPLTCETPAR